MSQQQLPDFSASQASSTSSSLPPTQYSNPGGVAAPSQPVFLWTRDSCPGRTDERANRREDTAPLNGEEDGTGMEEVEDAAARSTTVRESEERDAAPVITQTVREAAGESSSTTAEASQLPRASWKTPTFSSLRRARPNDALQQSALSGRRSTVVAAAEEEEDDDTTPPSTLYSVPSTAQWRVPLQRRMEEAQASQARLRLAAALESEDMDEVDRQLQSVAGVAATAVDEDDDDLPRLADTDDSEDEAQDDESLDAFEMQDYLRYRLPTGFVQLDRRLGHEARHAAQDESATDVGEDAMVDAAGGLTSGGLLEVTGTPGSGKTTLLMQLAIKERLQALAQAARLLFGAACEDGEDEEEEGQGNDSGYATRQVVVIDTEGSVSAQRLASMAQALIEEALQTWPTDEGAAPPSDETLLEHTLAGIHLCRCTTVEQLLATFEVLLPCSTEHDVGLPINTSLIVLDSVSHFFREPRSDQEPVRRLRQYMIGCAQHFIQRAHACGIKVALSKQMSTGFRTQDGRSTRSSDTHAHGILKPMLADLLDTRATWEAWCVVLFRSDLMGVRRLARVVNRPASLCGRSSGGVLSDEAYWSAALPFRIDERGILVDYGPAKEMPTTTTTTT